jgi:nucleotide-binding universal stress UspA family protein
LPREAELRLITIADVFIPPVLSESDGEVFPPRVPVAVKRAHERAARAVEVAGKLAERAGNVVKTMFPEWEVRAEAIADSPAWAVVRTADEWKPDLVVTGAQGETVLGGRLILGSVSQRVLYEARCSVRVARSSPNESGSPLRIVVATDNSADAQATITRVASRSWPAGSEARIVAVLDTVMSVTPDPTQPAIVHWVEVGDDEGAAAARQILEPWAEILRHAGLKAEVVLRRGNPKRVLVEEAEEWNADSIFLGAKGTRGIERILLGSVSAAVAAQAPCSVEIVRRKEDTASATPSSG